MMKFIFLFFPYTFFAQVVTNSIIDFQQQIEYQFLGEGVEVYNVHYSGHPQAIGYFETGELGSVLSEQDFLEGIFLSTGFVYADTILNYGPNNSSHFGKNLETSGSDLIENLDSVAENLTTYDAARLSFDIKTYGDTLNIEFIYGSEEYNEYVGSQFQDIFACLFKAAEDTVYENIAKFQTAEIITVNTINNGQNNSGPCQNCSHYVYNGNGTELPYSVNPYYIQFDGFTKAVKLKIPVDPLKIYSLIFVIADSGDAIYDSGVFLKKGSIRTNSSKENEAEFKYKLFPNPSSKEVWIQSDSFIGEISIYSIFGKQVLKQKATYQKEEKIDISSLETGTYLVTIESEGKRYHTKLIVE
jgi:hypothetical protein